MKIPFIDLTREYKDIRTDIQKALNRVFDKGNFILGDEVKRFESEFSKYVGTKYSVSVGSGTDALFLALKALEIGDGDEVIVPAMTFIASAFAVSNTGAKPIFVDTEFPSGLIDPKKIEKAITVKTKAIIVVHLYGNLADMNSIKKIAKKFNLQIIEDASQAHGAIYKGKKAGSIGILGCFSFYPTKNMGAYGDCGIITTNSKKLAKKINRIRNYGQEKKYYSSEVGYNSRMDEIQAAVLRTKLEHLNKWNETRQTIASFYDKKLDNRVIRLTINNGNSSAWHIYPIFVEKRDRLSAFLKKKGIVALIHYPIPLHLHKVYARKGYKKGDFPNAERISSQEISIPIYQYMKKQEVRQIINSINSFFLL